MDESADWRRANILKYLNFYCCAIDGDGGMAARLFRDVQTWLVFHEANCVLHLICAEHFNQVEQSKYDAAKNAKG